MLTMQYDITVGQYRIGMLDKVEIHKSVELLADTATITLPGKQYNVALDIEQKLHRGNTVTIRFGYEEVGLVTEFTGYLQRIGTDDGNITLECEDSLFNFRKSLPNEVVDNISIVQLLEKVIAGVGMDCSIDCSYEWTYNRFVVNNATGFDVLKKVQEESGADIYLTDGVLHVHAPGENIGAERRYDFTCNIEASDLVYRKMEDKKVCVVVKASMPDGSVKEIEIGSTGGDKIEVKSPTTDIASMQARGEAEVKRHTFDGYDGSITTWLVPECLPGDSANIRDPDYPEKDGKYFVRSVTTTFGSDGGKRKVELGFRLS